MTLTANEQYILELVNRARANPLAEAALCGIDLNDNLAPGTITSDAKQPLALSVFLNLAADLHSQSMIADNYFSHTGSDGSTATQRIFASGWTDEGNGWATGENIAIYGSTDPSAPGQISTLENHHEGLFKSSGHRVNILSETFSEIGVGQAFGPYLWPHPQLGTVEVNASTLTQNFTDAGRTFITGVVIEDLDMDQFYDIGEGLGGLTVTATGAAGTFTTTTFSTGGYQLDVPNGAYTVTFDGGTLFEDFVATVTVNGENVKVDALLEEDTGPQGPQSTSGPDVYTFDDDGNLFASGLGNDSLTGGAGIDEFYGGGGHDVLLGNGANDKLYGQGGRDRLTGHQGHDTLEGGTGNDRLIGGDGDDLLKGQDHKDRLDGGRGFDKLFGGHGDDILKGGKGRDVLGGGLGADTFVFAQGDGRDRIKDFNIAEDMISIRSGANSLSDLSFVQKNADVMISFSNVHIRVEDVTVADMQQASLFDFV